MSRSPPDRSLRERLINDMHLILRRLRQTAIYVTHDQEEASALADRVVVMNAGQVEQIGVPQEIYCTPRSLFVARFLELTNLLPAIIQDNAGQPVANTSIGSFEVETAWRGPAQVLIRPDAVQPGTHGPVVLHGVLQDLSFRGSMQRIWVNVNGVVLIFDLSSSAALPEIGETIALSLLPQQSLQVFPST
jgi:ABC-type Fe3+/spermidine/putrescine transport system ATPase subunit